MPISSGTSITPAVIPLSPNTSDIAAAAPSGLPIARVSNEISRPQLPAVRLTADPTSTSPHVGNLRNRLRDLLEGAMSHDAGVRWPGIAKRVFDPGRIDKFSALPALDDDERHFFPDAVRGNTDEFSALSPLEEDERHFFSNAALKLKDDAEEQHLAVRSIGK